METASLVGGRADLLDFSPLCPFVMALQLLSAESAIYHHPDGFHIYCWGRAEKKS